MLKTIANTFYLQNVAMDPHNYEFRCPLPPKCMHRVRLNLQAYPHVHKDR